MVANLYDKQPALDVTRVHRARMYTGYILATRFERNTHLVVGHRKKIRFRLAIEILAASKFLEIRSWIFFSFYQRAMICLATTVFAEENAS